jgi:hypothetical protein
MPARRSDPSGEGTHHRFVRRDCAPWSTPLDEVMHTLDMLAAQDELVPEELFEMHSAQGCSVDRRDVCLTEATSPRYRRSFPKQSSDVSLTHGCAGQIGRRRPTKIMSMIISRAPSCDCSVTRSAAIYILVAGMRKLAQRTRQGNFFPRRRERHSHKNPRVDEQTHQRGISIRGRARDADRGPFDVV